MLSHNELIKLINRNPPLVEQMIDPKVQVQPNGIELTLNSIEGFNGAGNIAFDNSERNLPTMIEMEFSESEWYHLPQGTYKIKFNEIVNIPKNIAAIAKFRSSVMRCGVDILAGVWDAGYSGRSEALIVVYNTKGFNVKKNARLLQLLFFKLGEEVDEGYHGVYQNENIDKKVDVKTQLTAITGVGACTEYKLKEAGYNTIEDVAATLPSELARRTGYLISAKTADKIILAATRLLIIKNGGK